MEGLEALKTAIFCNADSSESVERCYAGLLEDYSPVHATIFITLLEMANRSPRIDEILKVIDLIRFPVKKAV